ncbi:putative Glutaredoxin [Venturia nashicola]|uniref:Putative Glutaredoxin n=1 Tax=Venturia nashicola TaxID=86259 RepID=A0A4Z1NRL7_9PEZI|nr:putative Glutaredoxin [Venturia nashicola]TLD25895.1 putative Glutaredoxin [Venturia nashicola]
MELKSWEDDPALYLFTSLTAGSSHIITATSRIETILKAARIPFSYVDTATNEGAKKLFQRRARGKKLPLLVKEGFVIADLEQVEDWNEFGELKDAIGEVATTATSVTTTPAQGMKTSASTPSVQYTPSKPETKAANASSQGSVASQENKAPAGVSSTMAQLAQEAAAAVKDKKIVPAALKPKPASPTPAPAKTTLEKKVEEDDEEDVDDDELEAALFGDEDDDEIDEALFGDADEEEKKEISQPAPLQMKTPLSPTSIPLPATPGLKSPNPTSLKGIKSPNPPEIVPEKSDAPQMTHRGSDMSVASDDEIRKVENDETIPEDDEGEEKAEKDCKEKTATVSEAKSTKKSETGSLADKVGKVKIQDQAPAEGKLATESVED